MLNKAAIIAAYFFEIHCSLDFLGTSSAGIVFAIKGLTKNAQRARERGSQRFKERSSRG